MFAGAPSRRRPPLLTRTIRTSSFSSRGQDEGLPRTLARLITATPLPESQLSRLSPRLTTPALLRALDLVRPPSAALSLFNWAHLHLPPSPLTAAKTLHILLRSHDLRPARDFLRSSVTLLPDHSFNALIRAHSRAGRLREAVAIFNQIPSPTVFSYNALLSALLRRGRTRSSLRLYCAMLCSGTPPDTCTFNTLIRGFSLNSMLDDSFRFFHEMSIRGVSPDIITYNTLLAGLCRSGKVSTARNLFDGMLTKSPELTPNVVSYTTLIRGYFAQHKHNEAVALFDAMTEPNVITYNTLIQGLCDVGRLDLVKDRWSKFKPDTCTFNTVIAAHCNAGGVGDAMNMFDEMQNIRVKADSATYSTLIRALCEKGNFGRAEELVDEVLEKAVLARRGVCVPLIASYNPVFEYLCGNGKAEKARRLLQELLERRGKVDMAAFKTVVLGLCKECAFDEGYKLLCSMMRRDLRPDMEMFMTLIDGCLGREKMRLAWNALKRMSSCKHRPSTSMCHVVLAGLLNKGGCAEEAGELVELMLERKIRQDMVLSTDVIAALFRNGLTDRAFKIVGLIYESGFGLKMEKLVECLCKDQKFMDARELLLVCLEKHQNVDSKLYKMVVNGLCATARASEAFGLFFEMTEKGGVFDNSRCLDDLKCALVAMGKLKEADFVSKQLSRASSERTVSSR